MLSFLSPHDFMNILLSGWAPRKNQSVYLSLELSLLLERVSVLNVWIIGVICKKVVIVVLEVKLGYSFPL